MGRGNLQTRPIVTRANTRKQVDLHGINSVTFTGHSLGGAIAQLAAAFFTKHHYHLKINCVTFGSPQVGTSSLSDSVGWTT